MNSNHTWRSDQRISYIDSAIQTTPFDLPINYFDSQITQHSGNLKSIIPDVGSNHTAALSSQLYIFVNVTEEIWLNCELMTFDNDTLVSLSHALVEGRMPSNTSEIIYRRRNASSPITLNDMIPFRGEESTDAIPQNLTIVGIVENVENIFYFDGFSSDIVRRSNRTWGDYNSHMFDEGFYTTNNAFLNTLNEYEDYDGLFTFLIDFNYQFTAAHVRNINQYIQNFKEFRFYYYVFDFCNDLYHSLTRFQNNWMAETARIFSSSIPILFLFGLVCIESLKIGTHELESKFRLMKIQGVETKSIRRMISLENLIISSVSFLGGSILGFFIGYFVFLGMG
ncbi:MAG: ABC transporter permease, partial [Candidatus Heimdallarchaeota archaeon]